MFQKLRLLLLNPTSLRLSVNFFSLFSIKGVDFLIPLLIFPYLVRTLGLDLFGLVSFSLAFAMYFGAVIHYGYSIFAVRDVARIRDHLGLLSTKVNALFLFTTFLIFGCFILYLILIYSIPSLRKDITLHLYSFFYVAMQSLFPAWFFQGLEKMKYLAYINITTKVLLLFSIYFLVKSPTDYTLVPLLYGIFFSISTIIAVILIFKNFGIRFILPSKKQLWNISREGWDSFISLSAPTLYNNTAMFILGFTTTNTMVGIYASATKLIDALNAIAVLLTNTFLPYLSNQLKRHKIFSKLMMLCAIVLIGVTFIFSDVIVSLAFSDKNMVISQYIKWLLPMVFFIFARFTYGTNYLMLIGKDNVYRNIILYVCIVFFIIALFIIPEFKIHGAIGILLGASFTMALFTFYYYYKFRNIGIDESV